jgi:hypothetical protein
VVLALRPCPESDGVELELRDGDLVDDPTLDAVGVGFETLYDGTHPARISTDVVLDTDSVLVKVPDADGGERVILLRVVDTVNVSSTLIDVDGDEDTIEDADTDGGSMDGVTLLDVFTEGVSFVVETEGEALWVPVALYDAEGVADVDSLLAAEEEGVFPLKVSSGLRLAVGLRSLVEDRVPNDVVTVVDFVSPSENDGDADGVSDTDTAAVSVLVSEGVRVAASQRPHRFTTMTINQTAPTCTRCRTAMGGAIFYSPPLCRRKAATVLYSIANDAGSAAAHCAALPCQQSEKKTRTSSCVDDGI